jgi:hypothetical protein
LCSPYHVLPALLAPPRFVKHAERLSEARSTTLSSDKVGNIVRTGLENNIPVSAEGVEKLKGLISDLSDKVKGEIQAGSKSGATIDPAAVAQRATDPGPGS